MVKRERRWKQIAQRGADGGKRLLGRVRSSATSLLAAGRTRASDAVKSMGRWFLRPGNALLIVAILTSIVAEWTLTIDDLADEVSVSTRVALAFAYAYAGAWVFNEIVIERPRRKARSVAYDSIWADLGWLANGGVSLLDELEPFAYGWDKGRPVTAAELQEFEKLVWTGETRSRWDSRIGNPGETMRTHAAIHAETLRKVTPFVHLLEDEVAAALIPFPRQIKLLAKAPRKRLVTPVYVPKADGTWEVRNDVRDLRETGLTSFVLAGERLRAVLARVRSSREDARYLNARIMSFAGSSHEPWVGGVEARAAEDR